MGKQKIKHISKNVSLLENDKEIASIARKRGIKFPSETLGFFKTVYAEIEKPNLNRVRLSRHAVETGLSTLIGQQVNFSHMQAGFIMGAILDAWINENDEIEIVYSFYKEIYPDEYAQSVELAEEGKLAVSFELLSERDSQEWLEDGTVLLHDITFTECGHLMDSNPACPSAKIYEFASKCKERLSNIDKKQLVCASQIEKTCDEILSKEKETGAKWQTSYINSLPNSSFAVIEPAYLSGDVKDKRARHLPFKDLAGKVDLPHYRNALARMNQIKPITDSISTEDLRKQANEELDKHRDVLNTANDENKDKSEQGGNINVTEEQKARIEELRTEFGDFAKDISDEDLLDDSVIAKIREEIEAKQTEADSEEEKTDEKAEEKEEEKAEEKEESEEKAEEKSEEEKSDEKAEEETDEVDLEAKVKELEAKVEELEKTLETKESEIATIRANAEKIGERKVQLKDNEFTKDFSDEDYLDEEKVAKAIEDKKNAETIASRKEELKDNDYAKDFSDEDYLNDDKVELARVKKEKDDLEASKEKEKIDASEKVDKEEKDEMDTGSEEDSSDKSYQEVMASLGNEIVKKREGIKVYKRK